MSLLKCSLLPAATPHSADAETAGVVVTTLMIKRNTASPKDEANKQKAKKGLENHCDQVADGSGDVSLLMHKGTELAAACVSGTVGGGVS